jgi:crossover junction endodeoxyribonuclease RuvC
MTLALGIDPGTATTGFGLVRLQADGSLALVEFGVITTSKDTPAQDRLASLFRDLQDLLAKHKPDTAAVEKLFFQRNVSTAISVGQARGVILLALSQAGIELCEYTPNEIKQAVSGYGSAGKRQMQEMVRVLLGLEDFPRPDDAADALAVAITHLHSTQTLKLVDKGG